MVFAPKNNKRYRLLRRSTGPQRQCGAAAMGCRAAFSVFSVKICVGGQNRRKLLTMLLTEVADFSSLLLKTVNKKSSPPAATLKHPAPLTKGMLVARQHPHKPEGRAGAEDFCRWVARDVWHKHGFHWTVWLFLSRGASHQSSTPMTSETALGAAGGLGLNVIMCED